MDPAILTTAFRALGDLAKLIPGSQAAKQQVELLQRQIELLEREARFVETERDRLKNQVRDLTNEIAELREQFAAVQLDTNEIEERGVIWKVKADGTRSGPYCPNHRDVRLSNPMGMGHLYCFRCNAPVGGF